MKIDVRKIQQYIKPWQLLLLFIIFLGIIVRLIDINKVNGMWYDENLCYDIAKQAFPFGILDRILNSEYHLPLYYFCLSIWIHLFGDSDVSLRLSSVVPGVLLIPVMYFLGEEVKSKKLGFLAALMTALSPILIYYSQEVRFYSLLTLFSALSALFMLKLIKEENIKNYLCFIFSALVISYTSPFGIILVFVEILTIFAHKFSEENKKSFKSSFIAFSVLLILSIPAIILNYYNWQGSNNSFIELFFWTKVNIYSLFFLLQDWFSPFLIGILAQKVYLYKDLFLKHDFICLFAFLFSPLLHTVGIIKTFFVQNKKITYLYILVFLVMIIQFYLSYKGSFFPLTRYTLIVFPFILIISLFGILSLKSKKIKVLIIYIILLFYSLYVINPGGVFDYCIERKYGIKGIATGLKQYKLDKEDFVLFVIQGKFLEKYYTDANIIDFNVYRVLHLDRKRNDLKIIFDDKLINSTNKRNALVNLYPYLSSKNPTEKFEKYINTIISKINKGSHFVIITEKQYDLDENERLKRLNNADYCKKFENDVMFSFMVTKITSDFINTTKKSMKLVSEKNVNYYKIYVFRK